VEVGFKTDELREAYQDSSCGRRLWGAKIARLYVQRVNALYAARDARELFGLRSLALHQLKGDLKGKHALRLDISWRLVLVFTGTEMKVVSVENASKHYRD
jgi:plasmid maintenance system killer protein